MFHILNLIPDVWMHVLHPPFALNFLAEWTHIKYVPKKNETHIFFCNPHTIPSNCNSFYHTDTAVLSFEPMFIDLLPSVLMTGHLIQFIDTLMYCVKKKGLAFPDNLLGSL